MESHAAHRHGFADGLLTSVSSLPSIFTSGNQHCFLGLGLGMERIFFSKFSSTLNTFLPY
jgi:hypothetical protein